MNCPGSSCEDTEEPASLNFLWTLQRSRLCGELLPTFKVGSTVCGNRTCSDYLESSVFGLKKFLFGERKLPEKRPGRNVVKLVLQRIESGFEQVFGTTLVPGLLYFRPG